MSSGAEALSHAHEQGLLHRDLKSANVIVTKRGQVKLLDFGLVKRMALGPAEETQSLDGLTATGAIVGTLAYMAPEVLRGEPADARIDLWALGVILHDMVAGTKPFHGKTQFDLTSAILREPAAPLPERARRDEHFAAGLGWHAHDPAVALTRDREPADTDHGAAQGGTRERNGRPQAPACWGAQHFRREC